MMRCYYRFGRGGVAGADRWPVPTCEQKQQFPPPASEAKVLHDDPVLVVGILDAMDAWDSHGAKKDPGNEPRSGIDSGVGQPPPDCGA